MHKKLLVLVSYLGLLMLVGCGAPQTQTPATTSETTTTTQEISANNGDEVQVSYVITFTDGTPYKDGQTTIKIWTTNPEWFDKVSLLNAKIGNIFNGELTPEDMNTRNTYDASKRQSLSQVYFQELGITPTTGLSVSMPGLWTGEITKEETLEGYNYYTVDFNAPETYKNFRYSLQVTDIKKA